MTDDADTPTAGPPTAARGNGVSQAEDGGSQAEDSVPQAEDSRLRISGIIETTLCCPDLAAAEAFYTKILNFDVFAKEEGRHLFFRCGNGTLLLFNPEHTSVTATKVDGAPIPLHGTTGAGHVAFRAGEHEIDRWKQRLGEHGVEIESEVAWPEGGRSIFFRDPAGNCLEFTTPATWGLGG